jgi:oxaloacetate decarboxylase beta subunit
MQIIYLKLTKLYTAFFGSGDDLTILLKNASYVDLKTINDTAQGMGYSPGILYVFYEVAIGSGIAPLLIFMGVGAMTDFGPLLANPKTLILWSGCTIWYLCNGYGSIVIRLLWIDRFYS